MNLLPRMCFSTEFKKYIVYDDGRIWSVSKRCFLKPAINSDGYPTVNLITSSAKNGYRQSYGLHRIIAKCFIDNPKGYKEVNHKDGIKTNCHWSNLEWCDRSYNLKHCHAMGLRSSKGAKNGNYKTGKYVVA